MSIRSLMTSDTHYWDENSIPEILDDFLLITRMERPNVIFHAGDWIVNLQSQLDLAIRQFRVAHPNIPILTTLGNHDLWNSDEYDISEIGFKKAKKDREEILKKHNVVHLSHVPYMLGDVAVFGFDGWYSVINPPTRDDKFLPKFIDGLPAHLYLLTQARKDFEKVLDSANDPKYEGCKKVLVSHFPTYGKSDGFVAPLSWHQFVIDTFDVVHYGHTHERIVNKIEGRCSINNAGAGTGSAPAPQYIIKDL